MNGYMHHGCIIFHYMNILAFICQLLQFKHIWKFQKNLKVLDQIPTYLFEERVAHTNNCSAPVGVLYVRACVRTQSLIMSDSFAIPWLQPSTLLCPWNSPGKNTRVGCHALLQGIFSTQGSNLVLLALRTDSLPSEPPGKPNRLINGILRMLAMWQA